MPPKQHSRPLASALHQVTAKIYRKRGFAAAGVVNNWPAIVGPQLARHTMPERLGADGTLRLRVDGPLAVEVGSDGARLWGGQGGDQGDRSDKQVATQLDHGDVPGSGLGGVSVLAPDCPATHPRTQAARPSRGPLLSVAICCPDRTADSQFRLPAPALPPVP